MQVKMAVIWDAKMGCQCPLKTGRKSRWSNESKMHYSVPMI